MKQRRLITSLTAAILLSLLLWRYFSRQTAHEPRNHYPGNTDVRDKSDKTFDRDLTPLIFTKHARCRMGCRHIDESEVKEILKNGEINYSKSEPDGKPDPKYAVEGITHDNQQVRIIFAPSKRGMVVITCIDIKEEWQCDCR